MYISTKGVQDVRESLNEYELHKRGWVTYKIAQAKLFNIKKWKLFLFLFTS